MSKWTQPCLTPPTKGGSNGGRKSSSVFSWMSSPVHRKSTEGEEAPQTDNLGENVLSLPLTEHSCIFSKLVNWRTALGEHHFVHVALLPQLCALWLYRWKEHMWEVTITQCSPSVSKLDLLPLSPSPKVVLFVLHKCCTNFPPGPSRKILLF